MDRPDITSLKGKGITAGTICQICPFHKIFSTVDKSKCEGCKNERR